ncbi:type II secretion system protein [Paenibacillus sp. FSL F4-0243]|uniref:type II secretion system protein n=1 Tax=Paenibacillus sp. FSL F4-0243 TaxID=2954732 RepID=UPI0030D88541
MLAQAIKKRLSKEESQKGFTLIELLAVIVILGIIAVIAIPLIGNVISGAKKDSDVATARQVYDAARLYVMGENNGDFKTAGSVKVEDIITKGYLDKIYLPSTKAEIIKGTVNFSTTTGQLVDTTTSNGDAVTLDVGTNTTPDLKKFPAVSVLSAKK